jgi:hypothetical protein
MPSAESFMGLSSPFGMVADRSRLSRVTLRRNSVIDATFGSDKLVNAYVVSVGMLSRKYR